jgi:hypothetical protein
MELLEQPAAEKAKDLLEQPAAEKAKEAEDLTCRGCYGKYTDARGSGGGSKKNYGFCSKACREAPKEKKEKKEVQCEHGRRKRQCKDCGTNHCKHGRQKSKCRDCGTGHCAHGREEGKCKDCGTGQCQHGLWRSRCRDCGTNK